MGVTFYAALFYGRVVVGNETPHHKGAEKRTENDKTARRRTDVEDLNLKLNLNLNLGNKLV